MLTNKPHITRNIIHLSVVISSIKSFVVVQTHLLFSLDLTGLPSIF